MMRVEVVPADWLDVEFIAGNLRPDDAYEARCMLGHDDVRKGLWRSVRMSTVCYAGRVDDVTACLFGVAPLGMLGGVWRPWLVGTKVIEDHPMTFLRRSRSMVETWLLEYPLLENYVADRNTLARRWLEWLGFQVEAPKPFGPLGVPFRRFTMRA